MSDIDAAKSGQFKLGDHTVNRLGFGAMRITGEGVWGEPQDRAESLRTLKRLPDLGVNFIDTADSYGPFVSEDLIREALHPYKGSLIATKGGLTRHGPGVWLPVGRPEYLRQCVLMSLRRLGVEQIDLWQLHRIDPKVPAAEQFDAMKDFQKEGLVKHLGLSEVSVAEIKAAQKHFTVANPPGGPIGRKARWLKPDLVAEVEFAGFTPDDQVRHGRFVALRTDKRATEVVRERAAAAKAASEPKKKTAEVTDIRLTHPDRALYEGVTKADVAAYLYAIAPKMLPFAGGRVMSLVRCPEGIDGERFFQKHANQGLPDAVKRRTVKDGKGEPFEAIYVTDAEGLASTAQVSALELHISGARIDRWDLPDRVVFDLDPDDKVGFPQVRDAAFDLRDALDALELESFALLTGGKGVHVVAPIARRRNWEEIGDFARALSERFVEAEPSRFVATMTKAKRVGKIFIDHFRNAHAATAIAPYSLRARDGAPVACPVGWDELKNIEKASAVAIGDLGRMLTQDPWKGYDKAAKQSISARAMKALGL